MRIYLAANGKDIEKESLKYSKDKPKYLLETFYQGEKKCYIAMRFVGNENFLLDSGAFSFMCGAKITLEEMDQYVNRYIKFIRAADIKYFFEIDVDSIFGLKWVELWRKRIETLTGKKCIPVWHKSRGVDYFKKLCDDYDYIAIGGFAVKVIKQSEFDIIKDMVHYAYLHNVKVHGLGFTRTKIVSDFDFYSVDSSSWNLSAVRGSNINIFNGSYMKAEKISSSGKKVKQHELAALNLSEWIKYQKYMDRRT